MSTSEADVFEVLRLPSHELLPIAMLEGLRDAAVSVTTSTVEGGEHFAMALAKKAAVNDIAPGAVILVPLFATDDAAVIDFTRMTSGPIMYLRLVGPPQPIMSYATCAAHSAVPADHSISPGQLVKFPSPSHFIVAKDCVVDKLAAMPTTARGLLHDDAEEPKKRPCIRTLEVGGD